MNKALGAPPAILVCEPQCGGFEHAVPNAALLHTVREAFPSLALHFAAEPSHLVAVRANGDGIAPPFSEIPIAIPSPKAGVFSRAAAEWRTIRAALRHAHEANAGLLLFASISLPGLWALHACLRTTRRPPVVLAVVHGVLAGLERPSRSMLGRFAGLRQALRIPFPAGVRLISLGDSIHAHLAEVAPSAARHFLPMDLPYTWAKSEASKASPGTPPCFGYIGVANRFKGFDRFVRVARAAQERGSNARFLLAGFMPEGAGVPGADEVVEGLGHEPLSREEYAARINEMDFVLWTGEPDHYRLTASASFLDALSFVKPGIYLSNPYIAHYAERMGDIGALCDSESALIDAVCAPPDSDRYARQCQNIVAGRRIFEPATLAPRLRAIAHEAGFTPDD